jgi:RNA recognition motif-containing protein
MASSKNPQLYVGGITRNVRSGDIEDLFGEFGKIRDINLKGKYAFVVSLIGMDSFHVDTGVL